MDTAASAVPPAAAGTAVGGAPIGAAVSLGGAALASLAVAARKRKAAVQEYRDPYWFYVEQPVPVFGLDDYQQVVGELVPGAWYLAKATYDEWIHAFDEDRAIEGWIAGWSAQRQDA